MPPDDRNVPPPPTPATYLNEEKVPPPPRPAAEVQAEHARELDMQALAGSRGFDPAHPPIPVPGYHKFPNPNDVTFRRDFSTVGGVADIPTTPWSYAFGINFSTTSRVRVEQGISKVFDPNKYHRQWLFIAPSSASTAPTEAWKTFKDANTNSESDLVKRIANAHIAATNDPSLIQREKKELEMATHVLALINETDHTIKRQIAAHPEYSAADKEAIVIDQIQVFVNHRDFSTIKALATGDGNKYTAGPIEWHGNAAELENYLGVRKLNGRYAEVNRSDAFKVVGEFPPGPAMAPPVFKPTVEQEKAARIERLQGALKQFNARMPNPVGVELVIKESLVALGKDADDGVLGNNPKFYAGGAMPISTLLSLGKANRLPGKPFESERAESVDAVIEAMAGGQEKRLDVNGLRSDISSHRAIVPNQVVLTDPLVGQLIDAVEYLIPDQGPVSSIPPQAKTVTARTNRTKNMGK